MVEGDGADLRPKNNQKWAAWLRGILIAVSVGCALIASVAWIIPADVVQSWAFERAQGDEFKRFEAGGRAEFSCWLIRFAAPIFGLAAFLIQRKSTRTVAFIANSVSGFLLVTQIDGNVDRGIRWRTWSFRAILVGWGLAAVAQANHSLQQSMTSWPYYRFRSGDQVLPNISDSNRDVIRYLLQTTSPNSRIFVASDQKLYFLSYYLLPRRLFYQAHPDSEFVIPQAFQQRRMAAYQLAEIEPQKIDRVKPDYILEYFEHPDFVDRSRLYDDRAWTSTYRKMRGDPAAEPNYLVCLRRVEKSGSR